MNETRIHKQIKILLLFCAITLNCCIGTMSVDAAISNEWEYDVCSESIDKLAYGKGKFVGISYDGYGMFSEDGYDWKKGQYIGNVEQLRYCGDYFYTYGGYSPCYISADGIHWNRITVGAESEIIEEICYYSGTYYAFVNQMIYGAAGANMGWVSYMYTSDDGVQWHYQIMDKGATHAKSIVGKNDLLTFGKQNVEYYDNQCFLWTGKDWKCVGQIADEYYNIVDGVYGNSGFVAVDDAGIIYASSDGQNWRKENSQSTVGFSKVIYGKNHYIAYNNNGELFIKNATDSTNAVWKKMELNTSICDIAYGDGKILVSSYDYGIMVNEAGGSANAYLSDVKFTNGKLADEFACGKFSYEVRVPQKVSELEIQPILMENGGKILLGKDDVEKEIPSGKMSYITIEDDVDSFYLKVVAENGVTYKKYFFDIQKNEQYFIEAESVTGGTVYGGGYGEVGEKIELSAKASEGYKFIYGQTPGAMRHTCHNCGHRCGRPRYYSTRGD